VAANEWTQRADQRRVRKLAVRLLDRFSAENDHLVLVRVGYAPFELTDQPGLAHPGLATEQHRDRVLLGCLT
jgi:hypothetical protein